METSFGGVGGYVGQTYIHPFILLVMLAFAAIALAAPRRYVLIILLIAQSFISVSQRIAPGGIDFTVMRILTCVAVMRIFLRKEYLYLRLSALDRVLIAYTAVAIATYTLQEPGFSSIANSVGNAIDNLGGYFVVRCLVREDEDIEIAVKALAAIGIILCFLFIYEARAGRNLFLAMSGLRDTPIFREGRFRAQGAYPHPILAGSFWAAIIPLFLGYWKKGGKRDYAMLMGVFAGIVIVVSCASSTPLMSLAFGLAASVFFFQRTSLVDIKIFFIAGLSGLAIFWNKPVWYLFTKIDVAGGSTGYFRYLLIDRFVRNWKEWLVIGVRSTAHWGEGLMLYSVGLADVAVQYVLEGTRGGILGLGLFMTSIVIAFKYMGTVLKAAKDKEAQGRYWQIGVSMLVHLFSFLGVSYFGQVRFSWWMTLAFVGCVYQREIVAGGPEREKAEGGILLPGGMPGYLPAK